MLTRQTLLLRRGARGRALFGRSAILQQRLNLAPEVLLLSIVEELLVVALKLSADIALPVDKSQHGHVRAEHGRMLPPFQRDHPVVGTHRERSIELFDEARHMRRGILDRKSTRLN